MDRPVLDLLERLSAARGAGSVWAEAVAGLSAIGVEWCHHAYLPGAWSAPGGPGWMRRSTLPPSWTEHYAARRYRRIDAASRHCARAVVPCTVGEEFALAMGDAAWAGMCAEAAAAVGVGCGLAVPLRPAPGAGAAGFSLLTRLRGPAFEAWRAVHGRDVVLVAHAAALRLLKAARRRRGRRGAVPRRPAPQPPRARVPAVAGGRAAQRPHRRAARHRARHGGAAPRAGAAQARRGDVGAGAGEGAVLRIDRAVMARA